MSSFTTSRLCLALALTAAALSLAPRALTAQGGQQHGAHEHPAAGDSIGRVAFPVSCRADVRPQFERGVAMLHSFWFEQAQETFESVIAADSACALAHWGIAMTLLGNPLVGQSPPEPALKTALAAAERASALAASATEREREYAAAALALYRDFATVGHRARLQAHEERMRELYERNPDDPEAAIFYARAIVANAPPSDLEFSRQLEAARILEPLFREQPNHPGLAHYLIHAFDSPPLAGKGLDAARRYAGIAPAAPHALHMPSHIFTRLGHWDESIETNARSAAAEPNPNAAVHPMDYMVYAYLQQGRDAEAEQVVRRSVEAPERFYGGVIGYNFAAMPARLALERGRWEDAAALRVPPAALPWVESVTRFARAVGAARSGKTAQAREDVAALASLRDTLKARGDSYWPVIVEAQRLAASAWVARAEGRNDEALRLAREAAALEETVEKHPVTPGPLLPARELEGDLLLELGRPAEALRAYERTLEREPRRARALYGAARAAELVKDRETARARYKELLEVMGHADASRPEPRAAKRFLETRG